MTHTAGLSPDESPEEFQLPSALGCWPQRPQSLHADAAITSEHETWLPT